MSSRVLIRKCEDPQRAKTIADEIARQSGYSPEIIYRALTDKSVCVRKRATEDEALGLKALYEALGAEVEIAPGENDARRTAPAGVAPVKPVDDDDDDEEPPRLLTEREYAEQVRNRSDIFYVENNRRAQVTETVSLVCSVLFCLYLGSREPGVATDFYDPERDGVYAGTEHRGPVERPPEIQREAVPKPPVQFTDRKTLQRTRGQGENGAANGGGDPRARAFKKGILGIMSGKITGTSVASADIFSKGGFAADIDAILQGVNGLRNVGSGGVGRKGERGIGYGPGYNSGFGEPGPGGIEDLIGDFSRADLALSTPLKTRGTLAMEPPDFTKGGALTGGRSKLSISRVVSQNIAALRHAYNKRLREKPGLKGKIVVKFAIDEFGNVIFCRLEETTMTDEVLEVAVVDKIRFWKFEKIDKPGDVTEVVYPFVFSQ